MSPPPDVFTHDPQRVLAFHSDALPEKEGWVLHSLHGSEHLGAPYEFDLEITCPSLEYDPEKVLKQPVQLWMRNKGEIRTVHGVFASFEIVGSQTQTGLCRAKLVPKLWYLQLARHNRVFQNLTVIDLAKELLKPKPAEQVEFRCHGKYPKIEFCVQYDETDFDFLSRWLEHYGIYYYWEHQDAGATLILCDHPGAHHSIAKDKLPFLWPGMGGGDDHVYDLGCHHHMISENLIIKDYNYRIPKVEVTGAAKPAKQGIGEVTLYGQHVKDGDEANYLAKVRAQEIGATQTIYRGRSTCPNMSAGNLFELESHSQDGWNKKYLIVSVSHDAEQAQEGLSLDQERHGYRNTFRAILSTVPFRPERRPRKPRIHGMMHAQVDSVGTGPYSEIDDMGRYHVRLPLDSATASDGKASRAIRMAQPYAGASYGVHFPLHKGTEVLLTFVDGDVDRPVIAAAIPNPATPSPVVSGNLTQSVIRTAGQNEMVLEDSQGSELIRLRSPHKESVLKLGAPGPGDGNSGYTLSTLQDASISVTGKHVETIGATMELTVGSDRTEKIKANDTITITSNRSTTIGGNETTSIAGNRTETVDKNQNQHVKGSQTTKIDLTASETVIGAKTITIGGALSLTVAGAQSVHVKGNATDKLDGTHSETVGKGRTVSVAEDLSETIKGGHTENTTKAYGLTAKSVSITAKDEKVVINAKTDVIIKCGSGQITVSKNGDITIKGNNVVVKGSKIAMN